MGQHEDEAASERFYSKANLTGGGDQIDMQRAEVWALVYQMASVNEGVVRVHPNIHGLYETWEAAEAARKTKTHPKNYHTCRARWRKP